MYWLNCIITVVVDVVVSVNRAKHVLLWFCPHDVAWVNGKRIYMTVLLSRALSCVNMLQQLVLCHSQ